MYNIAKHHHSTINSYFYGVRYGEEFIMRFIFNLYMIRQTQMFFHIYLCI